MTGRAGGPDAGPSAASRPLLRRVGRSSGPGFPRRITALLGALAVAVAAGLALGSAAPVPRLPTAARATTGARPSLAALLEAAGWTSGARQPARPAGGLAIPVTDASPPVRLAIPAIGVATQLVGLGLNADGSMQVPAADDVAGWFTRGSLPGQPGPAVIAGHVDSAAGPAVFFRLGQLRPRAAIVIQRADGGTLQFVVETVDRYPKRAFPTQAVFGPSPWPVLRLVTCGGTFDVAKSSYLGNVVVVARLVSWRGRFLAPAH